MLTKPGNLKHILHASDQAQFDVPLEVMQYMGYGLFSGRQLAPQKSL